MKCDSDLVEYMDKWQTFVAFTIDLWQPALRGLIFVVVQMTTNILVEWYGYQTINL